MLVFNGLASSDERLTLHLDLHMGSRCQPDVTMPPASPPVATVARVCGGSLSLQRRASEWKRKDHKSPPVLELAPSEVSLTNPVTAKASLPTNLIH